VVEMESFGSWLSRWGANRANTLYSLKKLIKETANL
jgi:hypothetical protein